MIYLWIVLSVVVVFVLLYFLAIMPRTLHKPNKEALKGVYYAHRGLHDNATMVPENSLEAFQKAVSLGYGIEMDVQLTKDRIPVVFHDFTLERLCGKPGKVCEYSFEELQEFSLFQTNARIPSFEEVLTVVAGKVPLIVELKVEWSDIGVCSVADQLLSSYHGPYCIESFNPLALLWYRMNRNGVIRGQLSDGFVKSGVYRGFLYHLLQGLLLNWITKPDFVAYNHLYSDVISRKICKNVYRNLSVGWTIKSKIELTEARKQFDMFIFEGFLPEIADFN